MALEEYVGAVVVEINGREIEAFSCSPSANTGRKPVKTMNRSQRIAGYVEGVIDAKVVIYPVKGNRRTAYTGCVVTEVGDQYETENEAKRDVKMFAQDKKEE